MVLRADDLLRPLPEGLYCPPADVFIDPMRPVERAIITHGHADHARAGHSAVAATRETLAIMAIRYGETFARSTQSLAYGEVLTVNGVRFTLVPAGHVLGSAQILVEHKGLRIVVSGDYKREPDPTTTGFDVLRCDVFITEATFGLPVFRHPEPGGEVDRLIASLALFPERAHLLGAYSLGKAQRLMALLRQSGYDRPIHIHGAVEKLTRFYQAEGINLGEVVAVRSADRKALAGQIVLCPPSAMTDVWSRRFPDPVTVYASGWMRTRARARQRGVELPLVVSDHADWTGLQQTICDTGAGEVWVTHGQEDAIVHWCGTQGIHARPLRLVGYGDEDVPDLGDDHESLPANAANAAVS